MKNMVYYAKPFTKHFYYTPDIPLKNVFILWWSKSSTISLTYFDKKYGLLRLTFDKTLS